MTSKPTRVEDSPAGSPPPGKQDAPAPLDSSELFQRRQEVLIRHEGALYRLRRTRNGKLILTK
jgi:hemin uptake protein HemP